MKRVFETIVDQFSASMSATATLIVEIIETIFVLFVPCCQAKLSKRLLYKEKENANAYIGDDSETAVMQDEFKANSKKLQDQISDSATALKDLQTAKGVLETDVAAFQSELAQLKADAATYKASLAQSQAEVDALKASLQALEDAFKAKTDGLVTELTTLQSAMEKDRLGFTSALNGLSEQYNKKLAELNSIVESEMVRLDELKADTDAQIAELNRQYKEALAKFEAMVAKGEMTSILSQVGTLFQIKASQINMALQGYYLIQQDVMVAIQEQKCAKVLNRSIEQAVVDRNILALEEQLLFIRSETAVLNGKLSALEAQECEYVAMIQSAAGLDLAATNGDAAIDLNPAAGEIAAILDEINLGITTEQTAMNDAIQARCVLVNAALEQCTGSLGESASRSIGTRAAHKTTKRLGEGVGAIAAGGRKVATLMNPRNW
jgi:chromosome segregation ATPase